MPPVIACWVPLHWTKHLSRQINPLFLLFWVAPFAIVFKQGSSRSRLTMRTKSTIWSKLKRNTVGEEKLQWPAGSCREKKPYNLHALPPLSSTSDQESTFVWEKKTEIRWSEILRISDTTNNIDQWKSEPATKRSYLHIFSIQTIPKRLFDQMWINCYFLCRTGTSDVPNGDGTRIWQIWPNLWHFLHNRWKLDGPKDLRWCCK